MSDQSGNVFQQSLVARGLALGDLNDDGWTDVLMTENGGKAHLLRNDAALETQAISVRLRGEYPNLNALGARVAVTAAGQTQQQLVRTGSSYLSQSSAALTFGLGNAGSVDHLSVIWPDGTEEIVSENIRAGFRYTIDQKSGIVAEASFSSK